MDAEQFHTGVVALFKGALASWDYYNNPLEWEGLPAQSEMFFKTCLEAALTKEEWGGPIRVRCDDNDPLVEARIHAQIHVFEDGHYVDYSDPLSDQLIRDCDGSDQGWLLVRHIRAIELSLERAKEKAAALGWDLSL